MSMPVRLRRKAKTVEWTCNSDPRKLDAMYVRLLGEGGDKLLSDEVKWLAITHKSFDQGKRGFNDRLSYLGKRIVDLQTSMALVSAPRGRSAQGPDEYDRVPFHHPALEGLANLSERTKAEMLGKTRVAQLAQNQGLDKVMRWKPRKADNLLGSGQDVVLAQALYGIIGALALERGGEVAARITKEKILEPLGVVF
ncbi:hypothetical protein EJ08DRAFT_602148 [Tothia fuscella]|uniref:RNase III domain-containing protein n=1 Tax=Tothia fuscella TaxID=1048955 RepID=A0A9P4U5J3_9PEZI|nr:hypothetical protein EJ08DRAFT_602148 [Tothia fuscella]